MQPRLRIAPDHANLAALLCLLLLPATAYMAPRPLHLDLLWPAAASYANLFPALFTIGAHRRWRHLPASPALMRFRRLQPLLFLPPAALATAFGIAALAGGPPPHALTLAARWTSLAGIALSCSLCIALAILFRRLDATNRRLQHAAQTMAAAPPPTRNSE